MSIDNGIARIETIRENKLSLVERIADDLAHEIKNPLHSMVINLEVLRRKLARIEGSADELLHYVGVIGAEIERLSHRVDLLLRVTRSGPEPSSLASLADVLDDIRDLLEFECARRRVRLVDELPPSCLYVRLPRSLARHAFLALCLDVLDTIPPGGTLSLECEGEERCVRLRIGSGDQASGAVSRGDDMGTRDEFLAAIASGLAASIETLDAADSPVSGPGAGYLLTIPREP